MDLAVTSQTPINVAKGATMQERRVGLFTYVFMHRHLETKVATSQS